VGGTTDGDGAVDGSTVLDSTRSESTNHWNSLSLEITSGAYLGQTRTIKTYTSGVGFTLSKPFSGQILTGVTYRVISAVVYQPGITVVKNYPATVEPDTLCLMGIAIVTNTGSPATGDLTVGTITINRIRAGASSAIVSAAACVAAVGNIFYSYTFPSASWQAGDLFQAIMTGQKVDVNGITYDLSMVILDGRVSREVNIETDTAEIGAAGAGLAAVPWNAAWDTEVESEVNDALDTAIAELSQGQPAATPTIRTGLMLLYMMARNQLIVQTSATVALEIYNDAGTKIAKKLLTDDGSDYTEAKMTTGA
jgi:hypothetical protein